VNGSATLQGALPRGSIRDDGEWGRKGFFRFSGACPETTVQMQHMILEMFRLHFVTLNMTAFETGATRLAGAADESNLGRFWRLRFLRDYARGFRQIGRIGSGIRRRLGLEEERLFFGGGRSWAGGA